MPVDRPWPESFDSARPGLWRPMGLDPSGATGPTRGQARSRHWRRTSHGLYLPAELVLDQPGQRILEAGLRLPSYGGVTGWASLRWRRARWFDGFEADGRTRRPVDLAVRHGDIRSGRGFRATSERLTGSEFEIVDGLSVAVPVRAVLYEMRYALGERSAALHLSMAAYDDLASVAEARSFATPGLNGWIGIPQARRAIELAEENCWSPQEFLMVLTWQLDAGFPRPLCNHPVFDRQGRHIGTPDLLDVEAGVVGEYDGALHLAADRRSTDLEREDAFRRVGLEYFTVVAADRARPERIVQRMTAARSRARWERQSARAWTVQPPSWWVPTVTVGQRRSLTDEQRARFLRRRMA